MITTPRFIVDHNVGKLTRYLRMMGYDTVFFTGDDDGRMVARAGKETRIILTKDTQVMERRVITKGRVRAILIKGDRAEDQIRQVISTLNLDPQFQPFTICLECNRRLNEVSREAVKDRVPAYVFRTQSQYMACPGCGRVYWRGTHWREMTEKLQNFVTGQEDTDNKCQPGSENNANNR